VIRLNKFGGNPTILRRSDAGEEKRCEIVREKDFLSRSRKIGLPKK